MMVVALLFWVTPIWLNWHAEKYFKLHSNNGVEEARSTLLIIMAVAAILFVFTAYLSKKTKTNKYLYISFASYILFWGWLIWLFSGVLILWN